MLTGWTPTGPAAARARDRTLDLLAAGPAAMTRATAPGTSPPARWSLDPTGGRVLLCLHGKFRKWVQLGGHCEPGDRTLAGAALREATEESGIAGLTVDPVPIDVDIHPVRCQGGSLHYDVRFAVFAPAGAVERVSDGVRGAGLVPAGPAARAAGRRRPPARRAGPRRPGPPDRRLNRRPLTRTHARPAAEPAAGPGRARVRRGSPRPAP